MVIFRLVLIPVICILLLLPFFITNNSYTDVHNIAFITYGKEGIETIYGFNWAFFTAGILFIVAAITDFLDGYIARKYNQITDFGKLWDPLADKILTDCVLIIFAIACILPSLLILIILIRDIVVTIFRSIAKKKGNIMPADTLGKYKTALLLVFLSIVFMIHPVYYDITSGSEVRVLHLFMWNVKTFIYALPLIIVTILSLISGIEYGKATFDKKKPT